MTDHHKRLVNWRHGSKNIDSSSIIINDGRHPSLEHETVEINFYDIFVFNNNNLILCIYVYFVVVPRENYEYIVDIYYEKVRERSEIQSLIVSSGDKLKTFIPPLYKQFRGTVEKLCLNWTIKEYQRHR